MHPRVTTPTRKLCRRSGLALLALMAIGSTGCAVSRSCTWAQSAPPIPAGGDVVFAPDDDGVRVDRATDAPASRARF